MPPRHDPFVPPPKPTLPRFGSTRARQSSHQAGNGRGGRKPKPTAGTWRRKAKGQGCRKRWPRHTRTRSGASRSQARADRVASLPRGQAIAGHRGRTVPGGSFRRAPDPGGRCRTGRTCSYQAPDDFFQTASKLRRRGSRRRRAGPNPPQPPPAPGRDKQYGVRGSVTDSGEERGTASSPPPPCSRR